MPRTAQLSEWLRQQLDGRPFEVAAASADASFRRYFRVREADGRTLVVMDAAPEHEDCRPWLAIRQQLADGGLYVPQVLAEDVAQGFILMNDLGDVTLKDALLVEPAPSAGEVHSLYIDAIGALIAMQRLDASALAPYSHELLMREMRLFPDWYLDRHLGKPLADEARARLEAVFETIAADNLAQTQVFVHRDFQIRNLMLPAQGPRPVLIDFQDAVRGPVSYDILSLLKDAFVSQEEEFLLDLLIRYWDGARRVGVPVPEDFALFQRQFDFMGVQRHLKVLGIFARLAYRDGKQGYLGELPRMLGWLWPVCRRYAALAPLLDILEKTHPEQVQHGFSF